MSGLIKNFKVSQLNKSEVTQMQNIETSIEGNILTLKIDLSKRIGPSSSGKTIIVATTSGNTPVMGNKDIKMGINLFIKNPDYQE